MRVLCVTNMYPPHHLGGYELVCQGAVGHLRAEGHRVRVLTTDHRRPEVTESDDPDVRRSLAWYWHDHGFPAKSRAERLTLEYRNAAAFTRQVLALRPDVVAWWAMGGMSLSLLSHARRLRLPAVAFVHDDWPLYGPKVDGWLATWARHPGLGRLAGLSGVPTRFIPATVQRWVFVSDFLRRRAAAAGLRMPHTAVAHSGVGEEFLGDAVDSDWRWRLLCVGRIDERKGLQVAIRVLAGLPSEATLTIVGDGDERHRRRLFELVAALGLESRVRLAPGSERRGLVQVYDDHDAVLFLPLWDEPWGLVPLEAMARGRPVVAAATGGAAEYLDADGNALVVERGDAAAAARAVRRLAADPGLRRRLREAGLDTARRHSESGFHRAVAAELRAAVDGRQGATGADSP